MIITIIIIAWFSDMYLETRKTVGKTTEDSGFESIASMCLCILFAFSKQYKIYKKNCNEILQMAVCGLFGGGMASCSTCSGQGDKVTGTLVIIIIIIIITIIIIIIMIIIIHIIIIIITIKLMESICRARQRTSQHLCRIFSS